MRNRSNEVKTPDWVVKKMVDNLEPIELEATYCEICCWHAPFLEEILKRKLAICKDYDDVIQAYQTCYGYELYEDNLEEGREKLKSHFKDDLNISIIVNTNLVLMDGLTGKDPKTGEDTLFYDWKRGEWSKWDENESDSDKRSN